MDIRQIYQQQKNFWAGVFVVFLLILFFSFSFSGKNKVPAADVLTVFATYNKADGVNVGTAVRLAGMQIGQVSNIRLDNFYRVQMTFSLNSDIELPIDSAAMIETDGIIGAKYIELLPGGEADIMQNGDFFMYTQDVLLLDELLDRVIGIMRLKKGLTATVDTGENNK